MTDAPLEDLPFDELRQRAFHVAEHRLDLGFFVDVYSHMPGMVAIEGEGGDLGSTGGTIIESIRAFKQMFGDSPDIDLVSDIGMKPPQKRHLMSFLAALQP